MIDLESRLISFLKLQEDPVTIYTLQKALGEPATERSYLRSLLRELCRRGEVIKKGTKFWVPDGSVRTRQIKRAKHKSITGRLMLHRRGFGFVTPTGESTSRRGQDWMVEFDYLNGAQNGDLVEVEYLEIRKGRKFGRVVKILQFGKKTLLGRVQLKKGSNLFLPLAGKQPPFSISIPKGTHIPEDYIVVLKRTAKGGWEWDKVLGSLDDPLIDDMLVLSEFGITWEFPAEVLKEADEVGDRSQYSASDREDFTSMTVFTVDGADAKDFDDAIHIQSQPDGYELGVHIADVSHYVQPGSDLDRHAKLLGNSTYFPHKSFPMLPRVLSENLCSLNPHVQRPTLSVIMQLDSEGVMKDFRVRKGVIQSSFRLTYDQVYAMGVDKSESARSEFREIVTSIDDCLGLAQKLAQIRQEQGGLKIHSMETVISLDEGALIDRVWVREGNEAHQMIEMFMCLANEVIATYMGSNDISIPYRVHEPPERKKIQELIDFFSSIGVRVPHDIHWEDGKSLNRLMDEVRARSHPDKWLVLKTLFLKSLKRAQYQVENRGHFGLALDHYCHFTSPIRRYADLVVHQLLTQQLAGEKPTGPSTEDLSNVCEHISECERASAQAEFAFVKLKMCRSLQARVGDEFWGVIADLKPSGLIVELKDHYVEGMVSLDHLNDDYRVVGFSLVGMNSRHVFRIGDSVSVRLDRVDLESRQLILGLVRMPKPQQTRHRGSGKPPKGKLSGRKKPGKAFKRRRR